MSAKKTRRLALSALFVSMMLILGYIESLIPLPGPTGLKLGLSNAVLLLAINWLGAPSAFILMIAKVLLSGITFSGVNAMMYSLSGGVMSMIAMSLLSRDKNLSPIGVGAAGAAAHNVGQVGLAMILLPSTRGGLTFYMAVLMILGEITGIATGSLTLLLMKRLPLSMRPDRYRNE